MICCRRPCPLLGVATRPEAEEILAPFMPVLVPLLRAEGEITLTDAQAELLTQISAATIGRILAGERSRMTLRGRIHAKPGSLLKHQIPIRTFADNSKPSPKPRAEPTTLRAPRSPEAEETREATTHPTPETFP